MIVIGFDPGTSGALAVLAEDGSCSVYDFPTAKEGSRTRIVVPALHEIMSRVEPGAHAFVENVSAYGGMGATSAFSFGYSVGVIHALLAACEIPFDLVAAQTWTRAMGVKGGKEYKDAHRMRAAQLWPSAAEQFSRKKDADRADAALIAEYGRRKLAGSH